MVSLGINSIDNYIVGCDGVSPTRVSRAQCGPAGKLPDDAPASEWRTRRDGPVLRTEPAEGRGGAGVGAGTRHGAAQDRGAVQDRGVPDSDARTG